MAREYQPLLLEDLEIQLPGIRVRRMALHRHMSRVENVRSHSHPHQQLLLYLRGRGVQMVERQRIPVRRGSLISLQPGQEHAFLKERQARPICLVIDLDASGFANQPGKTELNGDAMIRIEQVLHRLSQLHRMQRATSLKGATGILEVLSILEDSIAAPEKKSESGTHPISFRVRRLIEAGNLTELTAASIAKALGASIDHLNRQLKRESGITIGQALATARLERACDLLRRSESSVGDVAMAVGYLDQNYFARWFRQHTGQTPTQWKKG